jgi:hypothetical protein
MFHIAENIPWRQLWNYVIEKFDYQGWVGRQLKYLIYLNDQLIGCMAFADAVLQLSASDILITKWFSDYDSINQKNV